MYPGMHNRTHIATYTHITHIATYTHICITQHYTDLVNHIRVQVELVDKMSHGTDVALIGSVVQGSSSCLCRHIIETCII